FVAEYFCELSGKNSYQTQQIRERIRGHAMLVPSPNADQALEFDHDEFRLFFLGEGLEKVVRPLSDRAKAEVLGIFRRGVLPLNSQHAFIRAAKRNSKPTQLDIARFLIAVAELDSRASYTQENASDLIVLLLSGIDGEATTIKGMSFGPEALLDKKLSNLIFQDCIFLPSSLDLTVIINCYFELCEFTHFRVYESTLFNKVTFDECNVESLSLPSNDWESWNPEEIKSKLKEIGISGFNGPELEFDFNQEKMVDPEIRDIEKIVRYFMRSTHISESVILMKLGFGGQAFIDDVVSRLQKSNVMEEIENKGGKEQKRFRLCASLERVNLAIARSNGSFENFLKYFQAEKN